MGLVVPGGPGQFSNPVIVTMSGHLAYPTQGGPNTLSYKAMTAKNNVGNRKEEKVLKRLEMLLRRAHEAGNGVIVEVAKDQNDKFGSSKKVSGVARALRTT